jgi:CubicO group peptidase (beta-lactamase class C family)
MVIKYLFLDKDTNPNILMRQLIIGWGILLLTCKSIQAQTFNNVMDSLFKTSTLSGYSATIILNDTILYQRSFGYADIKEQVPYTLQTRQPIASVSKTFVGIAVAKAVELGLFQLEDDINTLLPFHVANPRYRREPITVSQLVTHTSSITDRLDVVKDEYILCSARPESQHLIDSLRAVGFGKGSDKLTLAEFLKGYFTPGNEQNFISSKPGKTYNYSNIGAALAAYIVEVKSGMSFKDFTAQYIFAPLHMIHTYWMTDCPEDTAIAQLYTAGMVPYPRYRYHAYPAGELVTTAEDLAIYMKEILKGYEGRGTLLNTASYKALFAPAFNESSKPKGLPPNEPNIGILWSHRQNGIIGHTGGDAGVTSFFFIKPATHIGMILISNTEINNWQVPNMPQLEGFQAVWKAMGAYANKTAQHNEEQP